MGAIYSKGDQASTQNLRTNNSNAILNVSSENVPLNVSGFPTAFHSAGIGTSNHSSRSDFPTSINGAFTRPLSSTLSAPYDSFPVQGQRLRDKSNDDLLNLRYLTEGAPYQQRNISISPNSLISSNYKPSPQNYSHNQSHMMLNQSLQQNRSAQMLQQLSSKSDTFQNNQLLQSAGKLTLNSGSYPPINVQQIHQSSLRRPQLLSQPPNKRLRLTQDFTNISHQNNSGNNNGNSNSSNSLPQQSSGMANLSGVGQESKKLLTNHSCHQKESLVRGNQWQNREPSYYPQVENISPVPEDMRNMELSGFTEKDDIKEKLRNVDQEIRKQEQYINQLSEKKKSLSEKLNRPNLNCKEEESCTPILRDPIRSIIADNHRRAMEQHQKFQRICGEFASFSSTALPQYRQPSDIELLMKIRNNFNSTFKYLLIKYIRRRKLAEKSRLKILADNYEAAAKSWYKRLEKSQNSIKRRQKDAKYRDIFEKTFPEIRRNREEKEKDVNNELNDNGNNSNSVAYDNCFSNSVIGNGTSTRSVTHNLNIPLTDPTRSHSPYDPVKEIEKMKEYAIDPPIPVANWTKNIAFRECCSLIKDAKSKHSIFQDYKSGWSSDEMEIFKEQYINTPKNFTRIATFLPKKSVADCIHYYYLTKKSVNYKALVKKNARRRRANAERHRFRPDNDHSSLAQISSQPTNDVMFPATSGDNSKIDFIDMNQLERQQRDFYNNPPDVIGTDHHSTKSNSDRRKPTNFTEIIDSVNEKVQDETTERNPMKHNVNCSSEKYDLYRDNPDSDNDDGGFTQRPNNVSATMSLGQQSTYSSISKSTLPDTDTSSSYKDGSNNHTCSNEIDGASSAKMININNNGSKSETIHIKDAINFSIEQSLSQILDDGSNSDSSCHRLKNSKSFDIKMATVEYETKKSGSSELNHRKEKTEFSKNSTVSGSNDIYEKFQEFSVERSDRSSSHSSSLNRSILMKDFCTAQMMNQMIEPAVSKSFGNSSSQGGKTTYQLDKCRSLMPDELPSADGNKSKYSVKGNVNSEIQLNESPFPKAAGHQPLSKKSDYFIDRVSKLYEEEVEPYTDEFRQRSDSQRTRTSSEASQMYAFIKNQKRKCSAFTQKSSSIREYSVKMPPPESGEQKLPKYLKSEFQSKNYIGLHATNQDQNNNFTINACSDNSMTTPRTSDDTKENGNNIKITAASIINSLTNKNTQNTDVKVISAENEISVKQMSKFPEKALEKNVQMSFSLNGSKLSFDTRDKQNPLEDTYIDEGNAKSHSPIRKRDKENNNIDPTTNASTRVINKSPIVVRNSKIYIEKSNIIGVNSSENYDSDSPEFSSPGKLLIDLDNSSEVN